jgi:uncharacterized protein YutE (UPF0331/DUF86 family)
MLDRERILAKIDQMDGYVGELCQVVPGSFAEYRDSIAKRRACERLLQVAIECVLDICNLLVAGLRLGLPAGEDDLFDKLERARLVSPETAGTLRTLKGFRNIMVHEYGGIDDAIVYKAARSRVQDFETFKREVLQTLRGR